MKNLKILIIRNGKISKGPNYFPESLRVLEWHRYPSNCLPSNFHPKELAICKLPQSCITSFGFHGSRKKFRNLKVLNFDDCEFLIEIRDISDLPNLEKLSFDRCGNLMTVHHSIGFLNKLKILRARFCSKLTTFPPLNLTSLEILELSQCSSLENFPEILGEMKNLLYLELVNLGLKELPVSFQNLVGLKTLSLRDCGILLLPSNIVMMPKLDFLDASSCKGLQWVKSEEGEEKVSSIVCSNVYGFAVDDCKLYDDFFSRGFLQLDHVVTLNLRNNNFTFLPECIKELQFLRILEVGGCLHLQEIRGVPPFLTYFTARECISLSSSSSRMLSNQELHEAGQTKFWFPGATIPEWFNNQSRGHSSSFWFRNEFPVNVLCLLLARVERIDVDDIFMPAVFINGKLHKNPSRGTKVRKVKLDYTYLFDLKSALELNDISEVALEKERNQVEITYAGLIETSLVKATGTHVFRQDDIRYDDPYYGKRKLEHDLNSCESRVGNKTFYV
ncbi:hypothetical protein AAZX31_03G064000 [Glycine max]|nr:hypothetical protein GLYMA_03G073744v4 [Glycine max]